MTDFKNATHIMLDLETLGNKTNPIITDLGAVMFTFNDGLIDNFHRSLDIQWQIDNGVKPTASTILWWLGQSDDARYQLMKNQNGASHPADVIDEFIGFLPRSEDIRLWGNGIMADNRWLFSLAEAYDIDIDKHIKHWQHSDYRTFMELTEMLTGINFRNQLSFDGVKHDSVADATHQAKCVLEAMKTLDKLKLMH